MPDSFHHSILLSYQWHHLLLVGALCFRAMMLLLCYSYADNNHKTGKQWNNPHLFHLCDSTLTQFFIPEFSSPNTECVFVSNTWLVHFLLSNCSRRDYIWIVKSGDVVGSGEILLSFISIFISIMQIGDLHRHLTQLSSQNWHKHPNNKHRVLKGVLYLTVTRQAFSITAQQLSVNDQHTSSQTGGANYGMKTCWN